MHPSGASNCSERPAPSKPSPQSWRSRTTPCRRQFNFATPDPECDLDYTFTEPKRRPVNVAVSNAFGFGGHNTTLVFAKPPG
jgi:3-oxoacyl-(acyl-carrier-protein) synthase